MPDKEKDLKALYDACISRCFLCEMRKHDSRLVFSSGNCNSKLVVIGEGPGAKEVEMLETFVGPAGQRLNDALNVLGINRDDIYLMNIILCRTDESNRTPTKEEWSKCRPRMDMQLKIVNPKVILSLGTPAGTAITMDDNFRVCKMRGTWSTYLGYPVMFSFHPAYFIYLKSRLDKLPNGSPEKMKMLKDLKRDMNYFLDDIRAAAQRADELDPNLPPLLGVKK